MNQQKRKQTKGPAKTLSSRVIASVFKYRPTTEDRAVKKMLAAFNF